MIEGSAGREPAGAPAWLAGDALPKSRPIWALGSAWAGVALVNWPGCPPTRCGSPPTGRAWFGPVWAGHAVVRAMCVTRWAWGLAETVGTLANLVAEAA